MACQERARRTRTSSVPCSRSSSGMPGSYPQHLIESSVEGTPLLHVDRLRVDELVDPQPRQLAPVSALLDPPERQPRVRPDTGVDEARPCLELTRRDTLPSRLVAGEDRSAQPVDRVIGR